MKFIIFVTLFGAALCAGQDQTYLPPSREGSSGGYPASGYGGASGGGGGGGANIPILRSENDNNGDGNYYYTYETGNGINAEERGTSQNGGWISATGSFSYTAPDGQQIAVQYTSDKNGFRPVGNHLPTPPPIPDAILRSIEQNRAEEARGGGGYGGGGNDGTGGGAGGGSGSGYNY